jgi:dethiobiotin synthetase
MAGAVRALARPGRAVLVEGVGGLLCPLTEHETVADLAWELGLPLVLVTRRNLGTLNHTLLTLEAARTRGLHMAGIVVNEATQGAGPAWETNVTELQQRVGVPVLAVVPFQAEVNLCPCAALAAIDWWSLCLVQQPNYS